MATFQTQEQTLEIRLGADTQFPIQGSFKSIKGLDVLLQDIQILLLTIPGERVNRPEFGCNLRNQIWENINVAAENGEGAIYDALVRYEPRITVTGISSSANENTGLVTYNIQFIVKKEDASINLIFPFRAGTALSFS